MVPIIYKYLIGAGAVVAALGAAWGHGYHVASVGAERDYLGRVTSWQTSVGTLARRLSDTDARLRIEQQRTAQVQTVEVIKYVTKYRDVIREVPVTVECIDNSGLLDLLNATMPTVAPTTDPATGRPNGHATTDAPVPWRRDGRYSGDRAGSDSNRNTGHTNTPAAVGEGDV